MLSFDSSDRLSEGISQIVSSVFPKRQIRSVRFLEGGKTNSSVLVEFENCDDKFVLRQHLDGPDVCLKEVSVLQLLQGVVLVAEVIDFGTMKDQSHNTYLLYRYAPGQHFRTIRASGSSRDMADAAFSIGRCLSVLGKVDASSLVDEGLLQRFGFSTDVLVSPSLRERLGMEDCDLLQGLYSEWLPVLQNFANDGQLVHGDFNHRNIVLTKTQNTWDVSGILDWELATTGCSLLDPARFLCYERPDSKWWEMAFLEGLRASSTMLPDNCADLFRTLNTLAAAGSLAKHSTKERFIPELRELVRAGLRGKRIG
jgi:aminoglycoside phosphotransferase (APT) family kinase protein